MEFKLRPWHIDDLENLVKYANNFNISKNLTDAFPYPYTEEKGKWFIEMASSGNPIHIFAIDLDVSVSSGNIFSVFVLQDDQPQIFHHLCHMIQSL